MKNRASCLLVALIVVAAPLSAAEPVAVRVDVEPLDAHADGTRVAVSVHVSPEDRGRIGVNAMVRIELDGEAPPGQSPLWALRMDDGIGRIETVWPAGEHQLRVEISSPSGRDSGLWVGTVRVPESGPAAAAPLGTAAGPAPSPEPQPQAAADAAAGAGAEEPAAVVTPDEVSTAPAAAERSHTEAGAELAEHMADTTVEATAVPAPEAAMTPDPEVAEAPEPASAEEPVARAEPVPSDETLGGSSGREVVEQPLAAGAVTTADESREVGDAAVGDALAPKVDSAVPIVEPLRGETAVPPEEPQSGAPAPAESRAASPQPVPAAVEAEHASWIDADPDTAELTAVVLRGRETPGELDPADLRLRLSGAEVPIEELGDARRAPLLLGIAVDTGPDSGVGWPGAGGTLAPLAARADDGLGRRFYAASGSGVGEWDAGPPSAAVGGEGGDVAGLLTDSLERFDGMRGRRFLLLVTDGRSEPDKMAWQRAVAAAAEAGTPVLVVALWDERFSRRSRNNLRELVEVSGGSLFLVQGRAQLERAVERFGPLLDAGVALRFRFPPGISLPAEVRLEGVERGLEVSTAKSIR
jgi:hypothetical protein